MGYKNSSVASQAIQNATIVTTAETIAFISPVINPPADNALVLIMWEVIITLSAASNLLTLRLRRGNLVTSTLINVGTGVTVTASTAVKFSGIYTDLPGVVAGQQYTLTAQVGAASGNSTINDGAIVVLIP